MRFTTLKKFYNTLATGEHRTGDIWSHLPTHGLLKASFLPGIIITPACDLAQRKVETMTYLPVMPIRMYLSSSSFLPEVRGFILNLTDNLSFSQCRDLLKSNNQIMLADCDRLLDQLKTLKADGKTSHVSRCRAGLLHIKKTLSSVAIPADTKELAELFGSRAYDKILERIATNSFSNDIHFLPKDLQDLSWSIIREHSVVLFRYPLTAPIEIFNAAQATSSEQWQNELKRLRENTPFASSFSKDLPIKALRVETEFMHDLLTRFVSLYSRLGSPDLTSVTIEEIKDSVKG